jgi:uncharacterized protein (TIGR00369 family)
MVNDNSAPGEALTPGAEVIRQWLPTLPFVAQTGIRLTAMQPDVATLMLPFAAALAPPGTLIPGGAIAMLIDTAAMVAVRSGTTLPAKRQGMTFGLTVKYLAATTGEDLQATARVLRRARSLAYLDVEVRSSSGSLVAQGLVAYELG